jgi:hypothetical protein
MRYAVTRGGDVVAVFEERRQADSFIASETAHVESQGCCVPGSAAYSVVDFDEMSDSELPHRVAFVAWRAKKDAEFAAWNVKYEEVRKKEAEAAKAAEAQTTEAPK